MKMNNTSIPIAEEETIQIQHLIILLQLLAEAATITIIPFIVQPLPYIVHSPHAPLFNNNKIKHQQLQPYQKEVHPQAF